MSSQSTSRPVLLETRLYSMRDLSLAEKEVEGDIPILGGGVEADRDRDQAEGNGPAPDRASCGRGPAPLRSLT